MKRIILILIFNCLAFGSFSQINVGTNFKITAQVPIDKRTVVSNIDERDEINPLYRYEGLIVYVLAEQKNYQLRGGISNADWGEMASSSYSLTMDTTSCPNNNYYLPAYNCNVIYNDGACNQDTIFVPSSVNNKNRIYTIKKKSVCDILLIYCIDNSDEIHSAYKNSAARFYLLNNRETGIIQFQSSGFNWEIIKEETYIQL